MQTSHFAIRISSEEYDYIKIFCHAKADMIESEKIKRKGIKERRMRDVIVSNSECIYGETAIFLPGSKVTL